MKRLISLTQENEKLKIILSEILTGIDFDKPMPPVNVVYIEQFIMQGLDRMNQMCIEEKENPLIYEVVASYLKQYRELSYHFILDLKDAIKAQEAHNNTINNILDTQ